MTAARTLGRDLRVGDTIGVMWAQGRDTIVDLVPYTGPIDVLQGACIARFALNTLGMTIESGSPFDLISRDGRS